MTKPLATADEISALIDTMARESWQATTPEPRDWDADPCTAGCCA